MQFTHIYLWAREFDCKAYLSEDLALLYRLFSDEFDPTHHIS
jgi:hypothetical protein